MKRLIAIGDIHGQREKLNSLLGEIKPTHNDQLVFLGDYVDRGPDSRGVIEDLLALQASFPDIIFLRGNHDQLLIDALIELRVIQGQRLRDISQLFEQEANPSDHYLFMRNGGLATLDSYGLSSLEEGLSEEHVEFLQGTKLWWRHAPFLFVHAGANPEPTLEEQDPCVFLWERYASPGQNGEIHIVGHHPTPDKKPFFEEGRYSLDTGAGRGHALTACDVLTKQFWQTT